MGRGPSSFIARSSPTPKLEVVLDKPSELHDQLNAVLGLQELNDVARRLADQRKAEEEVVKSATQVLGLLKAELPGCPDPRASEAFRLITARKLDLDAIGILATGAGGPPDGDLQILAALRAIRVPHPGDVEALEGRLGDAAARSGADPRHRRGPGFPFGLSFWRPPSPTSTCTARGTARFAVGPAPSITSGWPRPGCRSNASTPRRRRWTAPRSKPGRLRRR